MKFKKSSLLVASSLLLTVTLLYFQTSSSGLAEEVAQSDEKSKEISDGIVENLGAVVPEMAPLSEEGVVIHNEVWDIFLQREDRVSEGAKRKFFIAEYGFYFLCWRFQRGSAQVSC